MYLCIPFTFSSGTETGVKMERTPLKSIKYFLREISMIKSPGRIKNNIARYFAVIELISIGLGNEYWYLSNAIKARSAKTE